MEESVWKQMYLEMVRSVSDVVEFLPETGEDGAVRRMLVRAMQRAEEIYIQEKDEAAETADGETGLEA